MIEITVAHWIKGSLKYEQALKPFIIYEDERTYTISIPTSDFGNILLDLYSRYDIMLVKRNNNHNVLWLDTQGKRFSIR